MRDKITNMIEFLTELQNSEKEYINTDDIISLSEDFLMLSVYLMRNTVSKEEFIQVFGEMWDALSEPFTVPRPVAKA